MEFLKRVLQFLYGLLAILIVGLICGVIYNIFVNHSILEVFLWAIGIVAGIAVCMFVGKKIMKVIGDVD